jgi:hypothetical protein
MSSYGDTEVVSSAVVGTNTITVSEVEPTNPVTGDIWEDPVQRTKKVFTGVSWEDFSIPPDPVLVGALRIEVVAEQLDNEVQDVVYLITG